MQVRVRKYLEYILEGERYQDEKNVLDFLSSSLQNEVLVEINVKALHNCNVLSYNFSQKFLNSLAKELRESTLSPEEIIFKEQDEENKSIYFISTGKVNIYYHHCDRVLKTLAKGEYFGEISFFSNLPRSAAAKSVNFTSIYSIPRERFIAAVQNFPQDKEQFYYMRDKILFENNNTLLKMICYSCGEEGHIAAHCHKVHFLLDRAKTIEAHLKEEAASRKTFDRKIRSRFTPRTKLEVLRNEANRLASSVEDLEIVLLRTQENETYANFYCDEIYPLLELKIYLPYLNKFGFFGNEASQIGSIGSVENLGKPQQDALQPPPQFLRAESKESNQGNLSAQHAGRGRLPFLHQSSITNGIVGAQENLHRISNQLPRQNSTNPDVPPARVKFDIVHHFEIYYPHGNITVISRKYNIIANETMAAFSIGRKTGQKITRNILKSIDILSKGSIYGNFKKSGESMISLQNQTLKKSEKDLESRNNSLLISRQARSSSHIVFADSSQSEAQKNQLGVNPSTPRRRESTLFLNPERLNDSSLISSTSVIFHHNKESQEAATPRISRFGAAKMASSSFIESQKPSNSNLVVLQDDKSLGLAPNSFGTEQNIASSILPRNDEPASSSNNNIMHFWKERQKSKASFQKSDGSMGSFVSPTFKRLSADNVVSSQVDSRSISESRRNSESLVDNDDSRSQISLFAHKRGEVVKAKHSSDKKTIQTYLRKAIRTLKEHDDKKIVKKKSQFAQVKKPERSNSVGKESKLAKIIKREGLLKPLQDIIVVMQADKQIFLENFIGPKNNKKS